MIALSQLNGKYFDFCIACFKVELGLFDDDELDLELFVMLKNLQKVDQKKHRFFSANEKGSFTFKVDTGRISGNQSMKAVRGFKGLIENHIEAPIQVLKVCSNIGPLEKTLELVFEVVE